MPVKPAVCGAGIGKTSLAERKVLTLPAKSLEYVSVDTITRHMEWVSAEEFCCQDWFIDNCVSNVRVSWLRKSVAALRAVLRGHRHCLRCF